MNSISTYINKYIKHNPTFKYIQENFFNNNINIDHIAHRSFDYEHLKSFYINNNFTLKNDKYLFDKMNVEATWLKSDSFRVFISQYRGSNNFNINTFQDYKNIQKDNDYVAWTLLHGSDINHIAIQVNDIEEIIHKIKEDGTVQLNNEDNPIERSADGKLLQASTLADKILYRFPDGKNHLVPYAFVEFVQRIDGREGFETKNATRIFTSTNL